MRRCAQWITQRLSFVSIMAVIFAVIATCGVGRLRFKNDYRMFFSKENPQLIAFESLQKTYTKSDNVLFVLAPREGEVFTREVMHAVHTLTRDAWHIPYVRRVDSITNFQHTAAHADDLEVNDLVRDPSHLNEEDLRRIRHAALTEPLLVHRLISPSGDVTGVNVTVQHPDHETGKEVPEVARAARELATRLREEYPEITVHLTGGVMMNNAFPEASETDLKTLIPLMLFVIIGSVAWFLRSLRASLVILTVLLLSLSSSLGLAGWCGISLSPTSATAPNIILILIVAFSIHLTVSFLESLQRGRSRRMAIRESIESNLGPISVSALTTTVGFLSMNASEAPPFRDLGNITAMGLLVSLVLSFSLLPGLLLAFCPAPAPRKSSAPRIIDRVGEFVIRRKGYCFWGMLSVVVTLGACVPLNELNDQFINYFRERMEFRRATDFTAARLTGIYYIDYSIPAHAEGITDPEYLNTLERFVQWYRNQPEVTHVHAITDVMKRLNDVMNGGTGERYEIAEHRALNAQYLLLYEMSLPYGLDLADRITPDRSATRMTVTLRNLSSREIIALESRAQEWLTLHAPPSMRSHGSSPAVMFAHIGQRNIRSMISGQIGALAVIFLAMVVAFRSVTVGLICMVPNIVPALMAFGVWGVTVGQVGLALSVVAAMTMGIIVDDTIHFIWKFEHGKREQQMGAVDAVRHAFSTVGTPIWLISFVFVAGFSVLSFSAFEINAGMGLLTALVIVCACLAELFFLPSMLIGIDEVCHARKLVRVDR